jgi:hypothetical protein
MADAADDTAAAAAAAAKSDEEAAAMAPLLAMAATAGTTVKTNISILEVKSDGSSNFTPWLCEGASLQGGKMA